MILFCIQGVLHAAEQKITYGIKPGQDYVYYDVTNGAGDDYILKLTVSGSWAEVDMSGSMEWSGSAGDYPTRISDCPDSSDPSYETFSFTGSTDPLTSASMHGDGWFGYVAECGGSGTAGGSPPRWDLDIGDGRDFGVRVPLTETSEPGETSALVGERIQLEGYLFYTGEEQTGTEAEGDWDDAPDHAELYSANSGGSPLSGTGLDNLIDVYAEASVAEEYTFGAKLHTDSEKTGQETLKFHSLDLDIDGVDDEDEEAPGGYIAVGTNSLQRINLTLSPEYFKGKDLTLKVEEGSGVVKVWENSDGTLPVISDTQSEKTWVGSTAVPSAMYVEMLSTNSVVNLELSYANHGGNTNGVDTVRFTFCEADIDVDSDRNGVIDGLVSEDEMEMDKPGVMIFNNDDDDGDNRRDYIDDMINGADDIEDLAKLVIRKVPNIPDGWSAVLEVSTEDAKHIKIFDGIDLDSEEIIGRYSLGNSYEIPDISEDLIYGIEAVGFADSLWNGEVTIKLSIIRDDETVHSIDEIKMMVAPFILLPGTLSAQDVYVASRDSDFVSEVSAIVGASKLDTVYSPSDVWVQDQVEIGYTQGPGFGARHVVWDLPRDRSTELNNWAKNDLLGKDFGQFTIGGANISGNWGGNIEVSPPISVGGTDYSFGRIILGENTDYYLKGFLNAQNVQGAPIELDVDWLLVGHVDEIISIIPNGSSFKVLIADTESAFDLIDELIVKDSGSVTLGQGSFIIDASKSWTVNEWKGGFIQITVGKGAGQIRQIDVNDSNTIVTTRPWLESDIPDNTSEYTLISRGAYSCLFFEGDEDVGIADSATSSSVTDSGKSWGADEWKDGYIYVCEGKGVGQIRVITGNSATQINIAVSWTEIPDYSSKFVIVNDRKDFKRTLEFMMICKNVNLLEEINESYQTKINYNKAKLKTELGITDANFIKIPAIYWNYRGVEAFLPGMVNMFVDNGTLIIPKPFGPKSDGKDIFEEDLKSKLGNSIQFVDCWEYYHIKGGEIHCGTNSKRNIPAGDNWWEIP